MAGWTSQTMGQTKRCEDVTQWDTPCVRPFGHTGAHSTDDRYNPAHPRHAELMLSCCPHVVKADEAAAGDQVDPGSLPAAVVKAGGGWVGRRYFTTGTHKDGYRGWKCLEVR